MDLLSIPAEIYDFLSFSNEDSIALSFLVRSGLMEKPGVSDNLDCLDRIEEMSYSLVSSPW